jgi:hypothetical protein
LNILNAIEFYFFFCDLCPLPHVYPIKCNKEQLMIKKMVLTAALFGFVAFSVNAWAGNGFGAGVGNAQGTGANGAIGSGTGVCPLGDGTGLGLGLGLMLGFGDGTEPMPQDGTGFGAPINR